eukprot:CAMPEP_0177582404 /NCGR_PEP_ID=MMETSP0419_2-20121207/2720_1 /TAXON_ID=582737 /ORGANISM="Tetraselmis sp., Strain GSL018" /LENGTH=259 /DNA_ID=CAMNT_0019071625 /DNA_START=164 /DNA_END=943 /DNA_ORIENTATION=-
MTQRRKTQERSGGLRVVVQDTGRVKNRMSKNQTLNVANRVVKRQQTPIKSGKRISNAKVSRRALTLSERFSQIENKRRELSKSSLAAQEIKPRRAVGRISQLGAKQATVTPKRNDGRGKPRVLTVRRNPQSTGKGRANTRLPNKQSVGSKEPSGRTGVGRKGRQNLGTVLLKRVEVFHKDRCAAIARASNRQLGFSLVLVHRMRRWKILTKTWTDTWLSLMKRLEVVPARFGNQLFEPLMCLYDALTPYGCQRIELFSF